MKHVKVLTKKEGPTKADIGKLIDKLTGSKTD